MTDRNYRALTDIEIKALLWECDRTRYPARNRVVVLLAFHAGLKSQEIARLKRSDVDFERPGGSVILRVLRGRGRKLESREMEIARDGDLFQAIVKLMRVVRGGRQSDPLILSERAMAGRADPSEDWHMRPNSIGYLFYKLFRDANLPGSAHDGRYTFIVRAARRAVRDRVSLRDVQKAAGHRSLDQVQRYLEADEEAQKVLTRDLYDPSKS